MNLGVSPFYRSSHQKPAAYSGYLYVSISHRRPQAHGGPNMPPASVLKYLPRYQLTPIRTTLIKMSTNSKCWRGSGKREPSYTVGGNVSWCSHCGRQYGGSSKKLKTAEQSGNPTPGHIFRQNHNSDTCTPVFTSALSTIGKIWKQTEYPSTDEWIKKMWCIYTVEDYSATPVRECHLQQMEATRDYLTNRSRREKDKYM